MLFRIQQKVLLYSIKLTKGNLPGIQSSKKFKKRIFKNAYEVSVSLKMVKAGRNIFTMYFALFSLVNVYLINFGLKNECRGFQSELMD